MLFPTIPECRSDRSDTDLLRDDLVGFFRDAISSSRNIDQAAARIADQIGGRADLLRIIAAPLEVMREQAASNDQLAAELDRAELELERRDAMAVS
jgi:hypothetical protein